MKDKLLAVLKAAISLGLIAYVVTRPTIWQADWRGILASIRAWPLGVALIVYFVAIGLNVLKWQLLLGTLGLRVPYASLFRHNLVGLFFANLPLSMIGGDIARGWDLARHAEGQAAPVAVSVLVDRLVGLGAYLTAAVLGLVYAVYGLHETDLRWLMTTVAIVAVGFALGFGILMSQRLRRLAQKILTLGPLRRFQPLYLQLGNSVQIYRTHAGTLAAAYALAMLTVAATCLVNLHAAKTVNAQVPLIWAFVLTPLTPFALYIPSIASGLGVNQAVFVVLYHNLTNLIAQAPALAFSLVMQVIIYVASLPGAMLWWKKRRAPVS